MNYCNSLIMRSCNSFFYVYPRIKINNAKSVVKVIITTIGNIESFTKIPTAKDAKAPSPN